MSNSRISELDSLRGIAAFTVLINHCLMAFPAVFLIFNTREAASGTFLEYFTFSPLHVLWNGHAAVILFFILSGFVLSVTHYGNSKFSYSNYFVKRMCRLYIPYAVIVTISVILLNFCTGKPGVSNLSFWFNEMWNSRISFTDYIQLLLLRGKTNVVNPPLWTIIIEIEISVILPFFIIIIKKMHLISSLLLVIACMVVFRLLLRTSIVNTIPDIKNLYYLPFFLFGSILYKYRGTIKNIRLNSALTIAAISLAILFFYNWEWVMYWVVKYDKNSIFYVVNDYMIAIGSILFIMICISGTSRIKGLMNTAVFQFLGKISYSLYLIHSVVILFIVYSFRSVDYSYLVLFIVALVIIISYVYYLLIEAPSIKLGKIFAGNKR